MADAPASTPPKKIVLLKMPSFTRLLIGGLAAFWLSTIMNPAFVAIAALIIFFIPVLTVDNIFSRQFERAYKQPEEIKPKVMTKSEYLATLGAKQPADNAKKEPVAPPSQKKGKKGKGKAKR